MTTVYTIRSGMVDNSKFSPENILGFYKFALKEAGFSTSQLPATMDIPVAAFVTEDPPFKTLHILDPDGSLDLEITTDTRYPMTPEEYLIKQFEAGDEISATTYTWNVIGPDDAAGKLREIIRSKPAYSPSMKFLHAFPLVAPWDEAAESVPGYPDKPPRPVLAETPPPAPPVAEPSEPPDEPEADEQGAPPITVIDVDSPVTVPVPEPVIPVAQQVPAFPPLPEPDTDTVADAPVPQPQVVTVDAPRVVEAPKRNVGGALVMLGLSALAAYFQAKKGR
jgi:hypothetical protein